jgi:alpha-L-fucosidase
MSNKLTINCLITLAALGLSGAASAQEMDKMWGDSMVKLRAADATRGQLFEDGNYAMFIHWGLYSNLGNKVDGKTYYGIGEWIMNPRMANIPPAKYKELAKDFNPEKFDAKAIAKLAKDAGMKYVIITSKHHDGFAMYHSKSNKFNVVDATPFKRDPMKDLANACKEEGIGFGFYYSHNQDWTFPGGGNGPVKDAEGNDVDFDHYFKEKCLPQVEEITSEYGPIELVWFDTPGKMPKKYVEQLINVVRKNQPNALVSGRAGHGLGDYQTLGDMEVPTHNVEGLWEAVDTTNDSWAYAWYDENWKTPKQILHRVVACVARGGTYMLNIGPRGDGSVPQRAVDSLRDSGEWIRRYPQVVYGTDASPWKHALPWGDVTVKKNKLFLSVFEWPTDGELYLPGLKTKIKSVKLLKGKEAEMLKHQNVEGWTRLSIPVSAPEKMVSVIEVELEGAPEVDPCFAVDPTMKTEVLAEFATLKGAKMDSRRWMEKFGEWKHVMQVNDWKPNGKATWEFDVLTPGNYAVDLTYAGEGRLVWKVEVEGGEAIQNQQNSSHNYQSFPIGWLNFPKAGRYKVSASCVEGDPKTSALKAIGFTPLP